jgi:threonine dehydrogenase-like Zn-dependent dehydrogenase
MRTICFEKNIPRILITKALRKIWPNVVFSRLSPTRFVDVPDGALPGPNWVRVKNRLGGICASDLHLLLVEADPKISPAALPGTDRIYLGHEILGDVTEVGSGVTDLKVGDRVVLDAQGANCLNQEIKPLCRHCREGNRALCENISLSHGPRGAGGGLGDSFTAHATDVYRVPDALEDETAVMIEPLSVGVRAALRRLPQAGEMGLVVGCGMIGLAVIQAVRVLSPNCHITVMARYTQQEEMARRLGANEVIVSGDSYEAVARITDGKFYKGALNTRMVIGGFDVTFDCVGSERTVQDSLRWTRAGGTVVLAGISLARMHVDLTPVWYQEVNLIGLLAHGMQEWNKTRQSTYDLTTNLLLEKRLAARELITHRFPLEQWQTAVRTAMDKRSGAIKVMIDYRLEK